MEVLLRPIDPGEVAQFLRCENLAFGLVLDEAEIEHQRASLEVARAVAAFDGDRMVGTAASHALEVTLPGHGTAPVAGISHVAVLPTHRRRGILRAMMRHQLDVLRDSGESLAALTASEGGIYGRFGYGVATFVAAHVVDVDAAQRAVAAKGSDRLTLVGLAEASEQFPAIFEEARRQVPGEVGRPAHWWPDLLADNHRRRGGAGASIYVLHRGPDGVADGYAVYRMERRTGGRAQNGGQRVVAVVEELVGSTGRATRELYSFLCGIDLADAVELRNRPVEDPLRWMLDDPRRLRTVWSSDRLWLRLTDLARAMEQRGYSGRGSAVVEVADAFCPWNAGRWRIDVEEGGARVSREGSLPAELALTASDLASAYLGGVRLVHLVQAGRVVELSPGAALGLDRLLVPPGYPFCSTDF